MLTQISSHSFFIPLVFLALFAGMYGIYRILFWVLRKMLGKKELPKKLIKQLRAPALPLSLLVAFVIGSHLFPLPNQIRGVVEHIWLLLFMACLGWLGIATIQSIFHTLFKRYGDGVAAAAGQRSLLTQLLFLYRVLIFTIIVLTLAAMLMTFPGIKSVGIGLLGSAGIAGIALGLAARPILLNLLAGFQIAVTKTIKIGDAVFLDGEFCRIESLHLTHVIVRTWDLKRVVYPISYFVDHPFQNWDLVDTEMIGSVFLYCDYAVPMDAIRQKVEELVSQHPDWNKKVCKAHMTKCGETNVEIRVIATANSPAEAFELKAYLREKIVEFLQKEYPKALPCTRYLQ